MPQDLGTPADLVLSQYRIISSVKATELGKYRLMNWIRTVSVQCAPEFKSHMN
jgi:hypothetical protein